MGAQCGARSTKIYKQNENIKDSLQPHIDAITRSLKRYRPIRSEIGYLKSRLRQIKQWEEETAANISRSITPMPRGKGLHSDPTGSAAEKIIERCQTQANEITQRIREMVLERARIDEMLTKLETKEREILTLRYIEGHMWMAVGLKSFLCERQCQRIAKQAIKKLAIFAEEMDE